jgi:hypothetical protein
MDAFHNKWLCCYPRPIQVTFDNGSEFKSVFKEMYENLGIKCRPTTSYNPHEKSVNIEDSSSYGQYVKSL